MGTRRGAITVHGGEARMQFTERRAARAPDLRLECAKLHVAVEHEIERRPIGGHHLLLHGGNAPLRGQGYLAGVGVDLATQQREQGRFAAAVGADDAGPFAGVDTQVRAREQRTGAALQRDAG